MATNIKKDSPKKNVNLNLNLGRVPPQSSELEEAVLGACMLEKEAFENIMEIIPSAEVFYVDAHQKIFDAIVSTFNSGMNVDLHTVTEMLRRKNELEIIGGSYYLSKLTMSVLSSAHIKSHAFIVMEKFFMRELIRIGGSMIADAYEDSTDVFDLMERAESEIKGITAGISNFDDTHVGKSYSDVIERYERQKAMKSNLIGLDTGLYELNELTGGIQTGLTLIAAYPSEGKTALMLSLMNNIEAKNKNGRCKAYSLETESINLTTRMAASENKLSFMLLQKGNLGDLAEKKLYKSSAKFLTKKISFSTKIFYIEDIEKSARKHKKKYPDLGAIFVDFIQLIRLRNNTEKLDKFARVGHISSRLKQLSKELEVPIIALSQLNTGAKDNKGKKPELENLANSVELGQNADLVIFIWYKFMGEGHSKEPYLIIAKNKDGKTGEVPVRFDAEYQIWSDYNEQDKGMFPSGVNTGYQTSGNGYNANDWID